MRTALLLGALLALVAAPMVAAQNVTNNYNPNPGGGTTPTVDVNVHNNPSESTGGFAGLSGTALIVLVVLAVIVIALIVALASRDRYP
jgi:hypothetical protein